MIFDRMISIGWLLSLSHTFFCYSVFIEIIKIDRSWTSLSLSKRKLEVCLLERRNFSLCIDHTHIHLRFKWFTWMMMMMEIWKLKLIIVYYYYYWCRCRWQVKYLSFHCITPWNVNNSLIFINKKCATKKYSHSLSTNIIMIVVFFLFSRPWYSKVKENSRKFLGMCFERKEWKLCSAFF